MAIKHTLKPGRRANLPTLNFLIRTAENSERTANASLFSRSPNGWESRISAENEMSLADNLPPEQ
jgi:hypothetical protein